MDYLATTLHTYGYFILFPLAAVEGPVVALIAGFFVYLGFFSFLPAYGIMLLGDIIPDSIYYYIGRFGARKNLIEKYSGRLRILATNFSVVERLWRDHGKKTMFFGKLAYGLSIPFLISAGLVQMSYRRFLLLAIPATLFQYGVIMAIGYALGPSYQLAEHYIFLAYVFVAIVVGVFIALYIRAAKYARMRIEELEQEEEREEKEERTNL